LSGLGLDGFAPLLDHLDGDDPLRDALAWLLHLDPTTSSRLAGDLAAAISPDPHAPLDAGDPGGEASARAWVARVAAAFPDDALAIAPLLLQVVRLTPGDAVHLPAGNLHAYLSGAGVEVMAASDNVLRGGLTPKHIDVDELLAILRFEPGVPAGPGVDELAPGVLRFDAQESAFGLVAVTPGPGVITIAPTGPSLLLATDGEIDVAGGDGGFVLAEGLAAFVGPDDGALALSGTGTVWWAMPGDALPR
jgi:mannose-6-phosphate isomerase